MRRDEKAVSPVIGVILMVAITVILAAVIASFVFGMAGTVKKTYTVAATASKTCDATNCTIYVTYQGGPDHNLVTEFSVTSPCSTSTTTPAVGTVSTCPGTTGRDHVVAAAKFTDGTEQVILDTYV
ncbi:MAG: type IV pilin N-terminal domain-containing protein [Archaeoglobaceae archaeon]